MDAILTAGGIPQPEEPLFPYTKGGPKALLDVAGKPMIQWVLDALGDAKSVDKVIIVGLPQKSRVKCKKPLHFVPNQGKMLDNLRVGMEKSLQLNKKIQHVLFVSSDIPAITSEMVDWVVETAMQTDEELYYCIIPRPVMEKRFPGSKRTYTHLKDMDVCGGDINVARTNLATVEAGLWEKISNARKSPLKQASLIGFNTLFLLILRQLTLDRVAAKVMKRLEVTGRAIVCPYAEVGMDIDKPYQLELLRTDLKKQPRKAPRRVEKATSARVEKSRAKKSAK